MKVIPFKKEQPPSTDDIIIDEIIRAEKIGTVSSGLRGLMFLALIFFMTYGVLAWVVLGVPKFVHSFLGIN